MMRYVYVDVGTSLRVDELSKDLSDQMLFAVKAHFVAGHAAPWIAKVYRPSPPALCGLGGIADSFLELNWGIV